jgi:sensor histidine kinase YesM
MQNDLAFPYRIPGWLQQRRVRYLIFWTLFVVYEGLVWGMVDGAYSQRIVTSFIELPIKILATYFTLYVLIDELLIRKKYALFLNMLLLSMATFGVLMRLVAFYVIYPIYLPEATAAPLLFFPKVLIAVFNVYSPVAILASFHVIKHWYNHQQTTQELQQTAQKLEKEKLESELKLLKSQINPHFLFNTLNNLYALTLNKSDDAPEVVYKLSELMNYMLYESNRKRVSLEKEIQYIQNYISLEKIRYNPSIDISLDVKGDTKDIHLAPLLILPFVENSFKHGLSKQLSTGWIHILIQVENGELTVKVENSKNLENNKTPKPSGIGLANVKRRLKLLYPNLYSFRIFDEETTYMIILKIKLNQGAQPVSPSGREVPNTLAT